MSGLFKYERQKKNKVPRTLAGWTLADLGRRGTVPNVLDERQSCLKTREFQFQVLAIIVHSLSLTHATA